MERNDWYGIILLAGIAVVAFLIYVLVGKKRKQQEKELAAKLEKEKENDPYTHFEETYWFQVAGSYPGMPGKNFQKIRFSFDEKRQMIKILAYKMTLAGVEKLDREFRYSFADVTKVEIDDKFILGGGHVYTYGGNVQGSSVASHTVHRLFVTVGGLEFFFQFGIEGNKAQEVCANLKRILRVS
jgi:hypothetical protein